MYDYVQYQGHAWIPCFLDRCHDRGGPGRPARPTRGGGHLRAPAHDPESGAGRGIRPRRHPVAAPHPLARDRAPGVAAQGLPRRDVRHFSLVGVVWDDPGTELHGRVEVRTRAAATGAWSGWQELETHNADHAADPGTTESTADRVRGATAPLWVGESDGVEVRVRADTAPEAAARAVPAATASTLPTGMRLELVDPGKGAPPPAAPGPEDGPEGEPRTTAASDASAEALAASAVNAGLAPLGATEIPALSQARTEAELGTGQQAKPYVGARPSITTRHGWGADEGLREKGFVYTKKVKAAFVHHSATGNNYRCAQAPSVIRSIYRYHVHSTGWRDLGYNFLVDKCGNIYEGRAGECPRRCSAPTPWGSTPTAWASPFSARTATGSRPRPP